MPNLNHLRYMFFKTKFKVFFWKLEFKSDLNWNGSFKQYERGGKKNERILNLFFNIKKKCCYFFFSLSQNFTLKKI